MSSVTWTSRKRVELDLECTRFIPSAPDIRDEIVTSPDQGTIKEVVILMLAILHLGVCISLGDSGFLCGHGGCHGRGCDNRNKGDLWGGDNRCEWLSNWRGLGDVRCNLTVYCSTKFADIRIVGREKH
jgi:hypothetical protein